MNLYTIRDWSQRYENAQSRRCEHLHWLPLPARHDSERYGEMMAHPHAAEIYAAWIMCLQVGARSEPRGSLVRSDGSPHTAETLAIKTRGSQKWFEKALPFLVQIGWLQCVMTDSESDTSGLGASSEPSLQEGKKERTEGMERKRSAKALPDEDFWKQIAEANPDVDIDRERQKMATWLLGKGAGKILTRARVVNWINGADRKVNVEAQPRGEKISQQSTW